MCYAMIAVAAISAVSAYQQADAQKKQAQFQSQVAENNAQVAEWQAMDAVQRGNMAAADKRREGAQTLGTQRAAMAAAGLDISTGSALSILEDTDYFNRYDQEIIKSNAAREAYGYRVQGSNSQATANMYRTTAGNINPLLEGTMAGVGSYYNNGGRFGGGKNSLMSGSTPVNPKWYGNKSANSGMFSGSPSNASFG